MDRNKNTVLQAIKKLGHKVSAADVAARTGLSLFESRIALNKIALETQAVLDVSQAGQITYKFFPGMEAIYGLSGAKKLLQLAGQALFQIAFFALRVSFGILLIASFITITFVFLVALIFILCGIQGADSADGGSGLAGGLTFDFYDWWDFGSFFSLSPYCGVHANVSDDHYALAAPTAEEFFNPKIDQDRGFFHNCFSFLFGDGNPNKELKEKQWQLIAEQIRRNHGVVTAEQLAPYMLGARTDSAALLDVMVRFDGIPEVTSSGNIVYCFPSLQVTASGLKSMIQLPSKLQENEWTFSNVRIDRLHWVFFFAGANLCGAFALYQHLSWFQPLVPYASQIYFLLAYAVFFMCFPICRQVSNIVLNSLVETRNNIRSRSVQALASEETQLKISEARQFAIRALNLKAQPVQYTTGQNLLEQDSDGLSRQFAQSEQAPGHPPQLS